MLIRLADKLSIWINGGVRVRVSRSRSGVDVYALGRTPGLPPGKLAQIVRELRPDVPGTIDFRNDGRGHWRIRASSGLQRDGFAQRVRNVVVNS
jgi:hypothetical protein